MDESLLLTARPTTGPGVLLTDLYELTMLQAYFDEGLDATASFELFIRALPPGRNFLVAAGLEEVLDYLASLRFTAPELRWLRATKRFSKPFLASLEDLRFTGDVDAMPEGTVFFPDEPVIRITAPLREAQLVESRLMNLVHYETLVASKAARCVLAASGRMLVDFGLRRSHGAEAALLSARASYLAGFTGTATVEAGRRWGVPVFGTMAHSYVQVHGDESEAFERFALAHRGNATLLIDTYDTERAARRLVTLAPKLQSQGVAISGVRLDSGDLAGHARRVRAILDDGGLESVAIFASGNLDEHRVAELVASGAPIDGFGVGTRMNTSADAPYFDCAYKLQAYAGEPRRKRSEGKATWPGCKQVYRRYDAEGRFAGDTLTLVDDPQVGEALLLPVVRGGLLIRSRPPLAESRAHANRQVSRLPLRLKSLAPADPPYPVTITEGLKRLAAQIDAQN